MISEEQSKFLGKLYDILIREEIIRELDKPRDLKTKVERAKKYFEKLETVQNKAFDNERFIKIIKELYYDKYIIKEEDIPESYFRKLETKYLNNGYGHVDLVNPKTGNDESLREECINDIIRAQKESMDNWLNYFLSAESSYLPMWAKIWAFQGMIGIGNLENDKSGYNRRSKYTINPFVTLDSEILARCFDLLKENLDNRKISDDELDRLVKTGNFSKLYGVLLAKKKMIKRTEINGIWVKYLQETPQEIAIKEGSGIEPEYMKLYNSLQRYNTGWCTAGSKETAKTHVEGGDFYVYYSIDENGEYKIPRIAIRMNGNIIEEIRGIAENQNIESDIEIIVEEKLKDFADSLLYKKKVSDMKMLTKIYQKHLKHKELSREELRFLYEFDNKINCFGSDRDPRIREILKNRNKKKDFAYIFNCDEEQIGFSENDLNRKLVYYDGDIIISGLSSAEGLELPDYISGSLCLGGLTTAKGLNLPQYVGGDLDLSDLENAEGLVLPRYIVGELNLESLISAKEIKLSQNIGGNLNLSNLENAEGLELPQYIGGSLYLGGLTTANGLILPQYIDGSLILTNITTSEGLEFPQYIGGSLILRNIITSEGLVLPRSIGGDLDLCKLVSVDGLILPQNVGGNLILSNLIEAKGLEFPQNVGESLYLTRLVSAKNLKFPRYVGGDLVLGKLTNAEGVVLPQSVGGSLILRNIANVEGLVLPKSIGGELNLINLINIEGLVLPKSVEDGVLFNRQYYNLDEIYEIQKQEREMTDIIKRSGRGGFTSNFLIIGFTVLISILSVIFAIIFIKY